MVTIVGNPVVCVCVCVCVCVYMYYVFVFVFVCVRGVLCVYVCVWSACVQAHSKVSLRCGVCAPLLRTLWCVRVCV